MTVMARAVVLNRGIAAAIERRWPYRGPRAFDEFPSVVGRCLQVGGTSVLADVGAGADSSFLDGLGHERTGLRVVGVDIASDAMEGNGALDERRVADVVRDGLPFADNSVAVVVSRSVLEHLSNVETLVAESARVLAPGGYSVHICSCRNAPFAIAGRALPRDLPQRVLFALHPEVAETQGFVTHYDRCTPNQMGSLFEQYGFALQERRLSYRSSQYFTSLGVLFLLARAYEASIARLGLRQLASYMTIVARKT